MKQRSKRKIPATLEGRQSGMAPAVRDSTEIVFIFLEENINIVGLTWQIPPRVDVWIESAYLNTESLEFKWRQDGNETPFNYMKVFTK